MKEFLVDMMPLFIVLFFLIAIIVFCLVDYYLYEYLLEKNVVKGYWDFNAYIYGRKNAKKYKVLWNKSVNRHPYLRKAKIFLLLYWGFMSMVFVVLFAMIWLTTE